MLVSVGCHHELPQIGCLKQQRRVLDSGGLKSEVKVSRGPALTTGARGESLFLLISGGSWQCLVYRCIAPVSASAHGLRPSVPVSSPVHTGTPVPGMLCCCFFPNAIRRTTKPSEKV